MLSSTGWAADTVPDFQHGEIGQIVESVHRLDRQIAATRTASRLYIKSAIRRQLSAQLVAAQEGSCNAVDTPRIPGAAPLNMSTAGAPSSRTA